jgi:hypothetical protein
MWRLIRGCGLSYSYGIRPAYNEARIVFSLFKATNAIAAYTKTKAIIVSIDNHKIIIYLFLTCQSESVS